MANARLVVAFVILGIGAGCVAKAAWIHVKAYTAQYLIEGAWQRRLEGDTNARPWPWADTVPVARLEVLGRENRQLMVLEGASGRNLAFGPVHDSASVLPGARGNSVISGHRDTHFRFVRKLRLGDQLQTQTIGAAPQRFIVSDMRVVDSRKERILLDASMPRLTLVTCYPFDAIQPGGPLRYVVTADLIAGAGNTPPRLLAHAARSMNDVHSVARQQVF